MLRPIQPDDVPLMVEFHRRLSEETVYSRYFAPFSLPERTRCARLAKQCCVDSNREFALVAIADHAADGKAKIVGIARLCLGRSSTRAEFAVVVADAWQGRGVGATLLRQLIEAGRRRHLSRIWGVILRENLRMRHLCTMLGFDISPSKDRSELEASLRL